MTYIKDNWFNRTFNSKKLRIYKGLLAEGTRLKKLRIEADEKAKIKEEADALLHAIFLKQEAERQAEAVVEAERQAKEDELKYYCGVYEGPDGSVKGEWHETEDGLDKEIERYRISKYKRTWYKTAVLPQTYVNDIAKEHNISIGEALSYCNVPA